LQIELELELELASPLGAEWKSEEFGRRIMKVEEF